MSDKYTAEQIERFWSKVDRKSDDECWNWTASIGRGGYGKIHLNRKTCRSNRVAWEIVNGVILNGLHVLHKCDNRTCCNPKHLFLGTNRDNIQDCMAKGRKTIPDASGEKNGHHKLTRAQVHYIRQRYAAGDITTYELAKEMGVKGAAIAKIIRFATWKNA